MDPTYLAALIASGVYIAALAASAWFGYRSGYNAADLKHTKRELDEVLENVDSSTKAIRSVAEESQAIDDADTKHLIDGMFMSETDKESPAEDDQGSHSSAVDAESPASWSPSDFTGD